MILKNVLSGILLIFIFFLLPSCVKYYKLNKEEFPQGEELPDKHKEVKNDLKTKRIYDEFETKAIFDVIYQSDKVREAYVDVNCIKKGKTSEEKNSLLQSELEQNKYWTSFYILADVRDKLHVALTDPNSLWSFYIRTESGQDIMPISIKEVELEPEYRYFFAYRFNAFKRSYHIKFPAKDLSGNDYFRKGDKFKLVASSAFKDIEFNWNDITEEVKVKEDYYIEKSVKGKKHNFGKRTTKKEKHTRYKKIMRPKKKEKIIKDEDFYWV